jgi:hypothetical protein
MNTAAHSAPPPGASGVVSSLNLPRLSQITGAGQYVGSLADVEALRQHPHAEQPEGRSYLDRLADQVAAVADVYCCETCALARSVLAGRAKEHSTEVDAGVPGSQCP